MKSVDEFLKQVGQTHQPRRFRLSHSIFGIDKSHAYKFRFYFFSTKTNVPNGIFLIKSPALSECFEHCYPTADSVVCRPMRDVPELHFASLTSTIRPNPLAKFIVNLR